MCGVLNSDVRGSGRMCGTEIGRRPDNDGGESEPNDKEENATADEVGFVAVEGEERDVVVEDPEEEEQDHDSAGGGLQPLYLKTRGLAKRVLRREGQTRGSKHR
eukprot:3540007-Rhodomonas_salina.1